MTCGRMTRTAFAAAGLLAAFCAHAAACSVCVGDPSADMTRGMIVGIFSLFVVILSVLGSFGYFFIRIMLRTRKGRTAGNMAAVS